MVRGWRNDPQWVAIYEQRRGVRGPWDHAAWVLSCEHRARLNASRAPSRDEYERVRNAGGAFGSSGPRLLSDPRPWDLA